MDLSKEKVIPTQTNYGTLIPSSFREPGESYHELTLFPESLAEEVEVKVEVVQKRRECCYGGLKETCWRIGIAECSFTLGEIRLESPMNYLRKLSGRSPCYPELFSDEIRPNTKSTLNDMFWSFFSCFVGMVAISFGDRVFLNSFDIPLILSSFGSNAVLIYAAPHAPFAQPRNTILGHIISVIVGVTVAKFTIPKDPTADVSLISGALAVCFAILAMQITKTVHPPGGATALTCVIGGAHIQELGYLFVLPVALGAIIMAVVSIVVNNISRGRQYPEGFC